MLTQEFLVRLDDLSVLLTHLDLTDPTVAGTVTK